LCTVLTHCVSCRYGWHTLRMHCTHAGMVYCSHTLCILQVWCTLLTHCVSCRYGWHTILTHCISCRYGLLYTCTVYPAGMVYCTHTLCIPCRYGVLHSHTVYTLQVWCTALTHCVYLAGKMCSYTVYILQEFVVLYALYSIQVWCTVVLHSGAILQVWCNVRIHCLFLYILQVWYTVPIHCETAAGMVYCAHALCISCRYGVLCSYTVDPAGSVYSTPTLCIPCTYGFLHSHTVYILQVRCNMYCTYALWMYCTHTLCIL
jgi:hypothetical protein